MINSFTCILSSVERTLGFLCMHYMCFWMSLSNCFAFNPHMQLRFPPRSYPHTRREQSTMLALPQFLHLFIRLWKENKDYIFKYVHIYIYIYIWTKNTIAFFLFTPKSELILSLLQDKLSSLHGLSKCAHPQMC